MADKVTSIPASIFTPTELRIMDRLKDCMPWAKPDLFALLDDELSGINALNAQLSRIRAKIKPYGYCIMCVFPNGRGIHWQICAITKPVRLI